MAGGKVAAGPAAWPKWEQQDNVLVADPNNPGVGVQVPIKGADPYFLWTLANGGRRVASVLPSTPSGGATQTPIQPIVDCKPTGYRPPGAFLQVLIEVSPEHWQSLDDHIRISRGGLRVRGAHKSYDLAANRRSLRKDHSFVTGIVADWWLECFLRRINKDCVRWEIGHARSPIRVKRLRETGGAAGSAANQVEHHRGWHVDDKLLSGKVMVIIDHGCPFAHEAFRSASGSRVRYVWFQGSDTLVPGAQLPRPVEHGGNERLFPYGKELRGSRIDALLDKPTKAARCNEAACYEEVGYELMLEASSHGGHVMGLACGVPNPLDDASSAIKDDASDAQIIFVELPRETVRDSSGGAMNVHLVDALHYVLQRTTADARVVVNCSFGTHGGPHDGSSMLEGAIDDVLRQRPGRLSLVVPIGNSFNAGCHAFANVASVSPLELKVDVAADKTTDTFIEAWFPKQVQVGTSSVTVPIEHLAVELTAPNGQTFKPVAGNRSTSWYSTDQSGVPMLTVVQVGDATATKHRILIVIAPTLQGGRSSTSATAQATDAAPYGHWGIAVRSVDAEFSVPVDVWIERDDPILEPPVDRQARFVTVPPLDPAQDYAGTPVTKSLTCTSYGTGQNVMVAGGYVRPTRRDSALTNGGANPFLAVYSSAGSQRPDLIVNKPDALAATDDSSVLLGLNASGNRSNSWVRRNGTSVAAPQLSRYLLNNSTGLTTLSAVNPSLLGERADGLSASDELLQRERAGLSIILP